MNRRNFLSTSVLTAAHLVSRPSFAAIPQTSSQTSSLSPRIHVSLRPDSAPLIIPPDFLGLGYEITSVAESGLLTRNNAVYVQLVRTLGRQGVIRIGGNTADYASYSPNASPVAAAKGCVLNDECLRNLGTFLEATNWKLIWALNLGQKTIDNAIAEARAVTAIAGNRLLAFEIGNEPDLYPREKHRGAAYDYDDWFADYRRYKAALRAQLPGIRFAGPDVAGKTSWVTRFAAEEDHGAVLLTHHYYREGQKNPLSTIPTLLGLDPKLQPQLNLLHAASQSSGLPYRICEVNSFSGGGRPGVSDTLAGALWALDYMFTLALNGCSGVNMETGVNQLDFISSYSPIGDDTHGHYTARPEFYGMLAFALAGKGRLLPSTANTASRHISAYITQPGKGKLTLTAINKGLHGGLVTFALPASVRAREASVIRLAGPALDARTGITLGEAAVAPDGTWSPAAAEPLPLHSRMIQLHLPAASAAIVQAL